jgi:ankyrin repeat protein
MAGNIDAIGLFCDSDPKSIDATNQEGTTPLMLAITNLEIDAAMALVDMGAWIDAEDDCQWRPLHFAVCLDINPDPQYTPPAGETVEIIPPITKYLIEHTGDIDAKVDLGNSPLSLACIHSSFEVVQALVDRGADVNSFNDMGYTPLHFAVERGDIKMSTYLISKGSKVNRKSAEGETALHIAMSQDQWEIAFYLLTAGADINIPTTDGYYPVHFVATAKPEKKTLMERFLLLGTSLDCLTPDDNFSPLDLAINNGNNSIAKLLESKGAKRGTQILALRNKNRS